MMFDRDFSFFNSPRYESYEPFGFGPRYGPRLVRDDPFWNPQQKRRVPRPEYRIDKECQCGHCHMDENRPLGPQKERFGEREIPVTVTKNTTKDSKTGQTKQKPSPDTVRRQKLNRQKNLGENQKKQKSEKETVSTTGGAKEQKQRPRKQNVPTARATKSNVGDKLNVGDRSNLTKEEPILVQLSTPEIKHVDFDPFQADEEIEIPPCL